MGISGLIIVGGVGFPFGAATNGSKVMVWDSHSGDMPDNAPGWRVLATNTNGSSSPSGIPFAISNPTDIAHAFFGDQQTLNFAVTPVAPNGTGTGEVAVDYVEVTVRYRLP
jgi:hypothetical protein